MVTERQKVVVVPQKIIDKAASQPPDEEARFQRCVCFTHPESLMAFLEVFDMHSAVQLRDTPEQAALVDRRAVEKHGIIGYKLSIPAFVRLQSEFDVLECNTLPLAKGNLMKDIKNRTRRTGAAQDAS